ncbi:MAG TPA: T9SS type A sorting domain-containing protein, partial [Cryomorphaceae bacterium]|nr:T9SS type A sorting domain-containing protein [Cryomorphaceae bacterium]
MLFCDGNSGEGLLSAFDFSCGELDTNTTYILMIDGWNGDAGTCFLNFEITSPCGIEVFGCTDPEAINYNPAATINDGSCEYEDCENNEVIVLINTENWGYEISWNIRNEAGEQVAGSGDYADYSTITELACLEDGCYSFELFDSFGDGWNGATFEILYNDTLLASGTLESGEFGSVPFGINAEGCGEEEISGCTDPEATNYNPEATIDDGSCEYFDCENNEVILVINTQNWGYEISWNIRNEAGEEVAGSGDYPDYSTITELACLEDGCYSFELFDSFGDGWNGATFEIFLNDTLLASGTLDAGEFGSVSFGVNAEGCVEQDILGCTDPEAVNYNPEATIDDGSCEYTCTQVLLGFDFINGAPDDSSYIFMNWVIENQFGEQVMSGNFYNWAPQYDLCLDDGCYTFAIYNISPEWNGIYNIVMLNQVLFSGEFSGSADSFQFTFGVNEDGCEEQNEIYGCTDPEALNYNPEATVDDGSCSYDFECGISFDVIADSTGENTFYIIPSENIGDASSVLWDFGDGSTSNEWYPTHIYEDDGPYVLCLFVSFGDSLGNFCEVSYCEVLDGTTLGGSGVLSGGFMINVIEPGTLSENVGLAEKVLSIYPNPTADITTISYLSDRSDKLTLRVLDLTGKLLEQRILSTSIGQQKIEVDLSEFPQGLYLIGLEQNGSRSYAKVVRR